MENLHAPTVPSGPTSSGALTNGVKTNGLSLAQLQAKKDNIEAELSALGGILVSHGVDMNTSLVTTDGFPRADLDVAQIRTTRSRIIHLSNDHKALMNVIEKHVHDHFASLAANGAGEETSSNNTSATDAEEVPREPQPSGPPFAKVDSVMAGGPAESAGLKAGDEVRNFGYVNSTNHDELKKVAECVQGNEGRDILVMVSRATNGGRSRDLQLTLRPTRDWGGRGLLGCHILPL